MAPTFNYILDKVLKSSIPSSHPPLDSFELVKAGVTCGSEAARGHKYSMWPDQCRAQRLWDHSCLEQFISIKSVIKLSFFVTSSYCQLIQHSLRQLSLTQVFFDRLPSPLLSSVCCGLLEARVSGSLDESELWRPSSPHSFLTSHH